MARSNDLPNYFPSVPGCKPTPVQTQSNSSKVKIIPDSRQFFEIMDLCTFCFYYKSKTLGIFRPLPNIRSNLRILSIISLKF